MLIYIIIVIKNPAKYHQSCSKGRNEALHSKCIQDFA